MPTLPFAGLDCGHQSARDCTPCLECGTCAELVQRSALCADCADVDAFGNLYADDDGYGVDQPLSRTSPEPGLRVVRFPPPEQNHSDQL